MMGDELSLGSVFLLGTFYPFRLKKEESVDSDKKVNDTPSDISVLTVKLWKLLGIETVTMLSLGKTQMKNLKS